MILMKSKLFRKMIRSALANYKQIDFLIEKDIYIFFWPFFFFLGLCCATMGTPEENIFNSTSLQYQYSLDVTTQYSNDHHFLAVLTILQNCRSHSKFGFLYTIWQIFYISVKYYCPSSKYVVDRSLQDLSEHCALVNGNLNGIQILPHCLHP